MKPDDFELLIQPGSCACFLDVVGAPCGCSGADPARTDAALAFYARAASVLRELSGEPEAVVQVVRLAGIVVRIERTGAGGAGGRSSREVVEEAGRVLFPHALPFGVGLEARDGGARSSDCLFNRRTASP